jgi:hypothetical protein
LTSWGFAWSLWLRDTWQRALSLGLLEQRPLLTHTQNQSNQSHIQPQRPRPRFSRRRAAEAPALLLTGCYGRGGGARGERAPARAGRTRECGRPAMGMPQPSSCETTPALAPQLIFFWGLGLSRAPPTNTWDCSALFSFPPRRASRRGDTFPLAILVSSSHACSAALAAPFAGQRQPPWGNAFLGSTRPRQPLGATKAQVCSSNIHPPRWFSPCYACLCLLQPQPVCSQARAGSRRGSGWCVRRQPCAGWLQNTLAQWGCAAETSRARSKSHPFKLAKNGGLRKGRRWIWRQTLGSSRR